VRIVIANEEARAAERLAEERAALLRVATLVARGGRPKELFAAVTEEVARVLSAEYVGLSRYESGGTVTLIAGSGKRGDEVPVGRRWTLGGKNINTRVFETRRPAWINGYADASGPLGLTAREKGVGSGVGTPIIVEGHLWGVMAVHSLLGEALPADRAARLANITGLLAIAIANAESRSELAASQARIVAAADETRRRLARDLHDGAQQRLVSIGLALRHAQHELDASANGTAATLEVALVEVALAIEELRELARSARPAQHDRRGVGTTLRPELPWAS
jgi:GAF domain-containing protein